MSMKSTPRLLPFFVYGTLLPGQPNAHLWGDGIVAQQNATLANGRLYDLGAFPMLVEEGEEKVVGWFVHDYETEEWIDATTAFFVVSEEVKSPMNHGIAAHAQKSAAEAMAQKSDGQLFTWQEVQSHATQGHAHS